MRNSKKSDSIPLVKKPDDLIKKKSMKTVKTSTSPSAKITANSKGFSTRQLATLGILACANLIMSASFSSILPFFSREAQEKGLSTTEIGMIFGIFELVALIASPLFGKYLHLFDLRRVFFFGLFLMGVVDTIFGFLNLLPDGRTFYCAILGIRCVKALGYTAFMTSSFVISAKCFPEKINTIVGIIETSIGFGGTTGSVIGGALYEYGGFRLPFFLVGFSLILVAVSSLFLIEESNEDTDESEDGKGIFEMLKISTIWIMMFAVILCGISLSFLGPTLADHLAVFNFSPTNVGFMFLLCQGMYTISAPILGILIDRWPCSNVVMVFGATTTTISMLLIGPSPLLSLEKDLTLIGSSLTILGVALAALYIPTYKCCLDAVKKHGFDDSSQTHGYLSGIFQSAFALGYFIGPTFGTFGVETIGFAWTSTAIAFTNVIFIFILTISLARKPRIHPEHLETFESKKTQ